MAPFTHSLSSSRCHGRKLAAPPDGSEEFPPIDAEGPGQPTDIVDRYVTLGPLILVTVHEEVSRFGRSVLHRRDARHNHKLRRRRQVDPDIHVHLSGGWARQDAVLPRSFQNGQSRTMAAVSGK